MKRERTRRKGEMSVALLVSLGIGSWAWGQCSNDAGAGDLAEGEACLIDEDQDTTNRGCYADPPAFFTLTTGDFTGGVVDICGSGSNYRRSAPCDVDLHCLDGNCEGDPNPGDGIAEGTCVGPSEPSLTYRDQDWYLIPQSVLVDHDADGNGVVRITSEFLNAEFDAITSLMGVADPGGVCDFWGLDFGCWDTVIPQASHPASVLLIIADHPDGVVVRTAPGTCDGEGIWEGYECGTGANDYILRIAFGEAPTACQPGPPQGPCNEVNPSSPGCEDPACCDLVCQGLVFCCASMWSQQCVDVALDLGCAGEPDVPGQIATGDDSTVDGYLRVISDSYGAWAEEDFDSTTWEGSDLFNPPGAEFDAQRVTYSSGFYVFIRDANQRELLSTNPYWQTAYDFHADTSLDREITSPNVASDTDFNGVDDHLESQFRVSGTGVDLTFDLTQQVEPRQGVHGPAATLTQTYAITNNLTTPVTFSFERVHDGDLLWSGSYADDTVGTGFHGCSADCYVFMQDPGDYELTSRPGAAINLSSPSATAYVGNKRTAVPDPDDPDCPAYGYGTDTQYWEHYGMPDCWRNHIAYIGHDVNGSSSRFPTGDVHAALGFNIEMLAKPSPAVIVEIVYTYGQQEPWGQENAPGPWDCIATGDDPDIDGYLRVKADPLGSFWNGIWDGPFDGDLYNPAGPLEAKTSGYLGDLYLFIPAQQREALITHPTVLFAPLGQSDESLAREITSANVASDTDGNGVDDQMVSQFRITGQSVDLTFDLTQRVASRQGAVSTLTQEYHITNNSFDPISFVLLRNYASFQTWVDSWTDDSVGTATNAYPDRDRSVFTHEVGLLPATAVTVSSPQATAYTGGKFTVAPPYCQAYGLGTGHTYWDKYGMPDCWRNHIANIGYDQAGTSGPDPAGDAFGTLEIPVDLLGGPGTSTTVAITHTYGRTTPLPPSCIWDCEDSPNGSVDVADFLALLAQWGEAGTSCDFDGGGVSVTDFLEFLAHFGPCP